MTPQDCAWCGEPATDTVVIKRGRNTASGYKAPVVRPACTAHAHLGLADSGADPRRREPKVEERIEPICSSCGAEITWIQLRKKDGARWRVGNRMPVDRHPIRPGALKRSHVVVNPRTKNGTVLTNALLESGEAQRMVDAGAQVFLSHFFTCTSAERHRKRQAQAA